MRLLDVRTFDIVSFENVDVPSYAILSHTWGEEEVLYHDMRSGRRRIQDMKGYAKIKQCCEQCIKDGLDYAWIDTCNIDKRSSAELSEAINSMFRYYAEASICYAYLSDVDFNQDTADKQFRDSRWFTRGWTLQELLAPHEVRFFSSDWQLLGSRTELADLISQNTGIHEDALCGNVETIRGYSIAQRMSWAARRVTSRPEDIAYSLFGIFNVNMPLLYGEGSKAFIRLQEEIMKDSDDQSIFAWQGAHPETYYSSPDGSLNSTMVMESGYVRIPNYRPPAKGPMSLLAPSPASFEICGSITPFQDWKASEPFSMTNAGLKISGPLCKLVHDRASPLSYVFFLRCIDHDAPNHWLGIFLSQLVPEGDQFARQGTMTYRHLGQLPDQAETKAIFVRKDIIQPRLKNVRDVGRRISFNLNFQPEPQFIFNVNGARPSSQLSEGSRLCAPSWKKTPAVPDNWSWKAAVGFDIVCKENNASRDFVLVVGYDGMEDRCWLSLQGSPTSQQTTTEPDPLKSVLDITPINKSDCGQHVKIWRPVFEWCFSVEVVDSKHNEINGRDISETWDGNPLTINIRAIGCTPCWRPEGPECQSPSPEPREHTEAGIVHYW